MEVLNKTIKHSNAMFHFLEEANKEFSVLKDKLKDFLNLQTGRTVMAKKIKVTISIGITELKENDDVDPIDILVKRADKALYEAKESGRNKVCLQ